MTLHLYNTLTRKKEEFTPLDPNHVKMYVCGPTVYDAPHLGNARSVVVYDVLYRLLKHLYPKVTYVRNITDVDDKINAAAKERGISIQQLTKEVTAQFHADMSALNCLAPTHEPRATEHIQQMIAMIEQLIRTGNAYVAQGHVLFDVTSDAQYGVLSHRKLEDLIAGARVEVESYKKHPGDFVLWKPADKDDDASSIFDSPWGRGRPGWHIECSAMSTHYLGNDFDIHGGGADLMFPHHENEIAQSVCANPHSHFANYWVHNGFLTVNGEKMSKSLGNFITVRELLEKGVRGEEIRFTLLSTHYRKPLDWTDGLLHDSKISLKAIADGVRDTPQARDDEEKKKFEDFLYRETDYPLNEPSKKYLADFVECLCDDLNFSTAIAMLHDLQHLARGTGFKSAKESYAIKAALKMMCDILGLDVLSYLEKRDEEAIRFFKELDVKEKIDARIAAKKSKNWKEADRIREELKAQGILLEDRPDGTTDWRRG